MSSTAAISGTGARSSIPVRRKSGSLEAGHPCESVVLEIIELPIRTMESNRMRNAVDCTLRICSKISEQDCDAFE
jgi:hypothetical protein